LKRTIICLTIILLATMSIPNSISLDTSKIIYVDDDNTTGPWDGSIKHPYKEIRDAIDNSNDGDSIFVFEGTYKPIYIVNKELEIIGQNRYKTKIIEYDDLNIGCYITDSKNFILSNFTIYDCSDKGIFIKEGGSIVLANNIVYSNYIGISIYKSNNNLIYNNIIINNTGSGILIESSNRNKIEYNEISNTTHGEGIITFEICSTQIRYNNINKNKCGIKIYSEKYRPLFMFQNNIINNNFKDNYVHAGIRASYISFFYTRFLHNYWGKPMILPKIIYNLDRGGNLGHIPCNIDWLPSTSIIT